MVIEVIIIFFKLVETIFDCRSKRSVLLAVCLCFPCRLKLFNGQEGPPECWMSLSGESLLNFVRILLGTWVQSRKMRKLTYIKYLTNIVHPIPISIWKFECLPPYALVDYPMPSYHRDWAKPVICRCEEKGDQLGKKFNVMLAITSSYRTLTSCSLYALVSIACAMPQQTLLWRGIRSGGSILHLVCSFLKCSIRWLDTCIWKTVISTARSS